METSDASAQPDFVELTAEVVAAYVMHNPVQRGDLAELIASVHASLAGLGQPAAPPPAEKPVPDSLASPHTP